MADLKTSGRIEGLRTKIAAIIEPSAFQSQRWRGHRAIMLRYQEDALAKADAILALFSPSPEGAKQRETE